MCLYAQHYYRCGCPQPGLAPRLVKECPIGMEIDADPNDNDGKQEPAGCGMRKISQEPYTMPWICRNCYYRSRGDYEMRHGREDGWEGWFVKNWYNSHDAGRTLSTYSGSSINDPGYLALDDDDDVMMLSPAASTPQTLRQYQSD